jgi:putative inorganic carbon (hco3(-)) transporter
MLTLIKDLLRDMVPLALYFGIWLAALYSIGKNARIGVMLLTVLSANPNIWKAVHVFPMGKDTTDLLFIAAAIGISVNCGGYQKPPRALLIFLYVFMFYASVWNASLRFDLGLPIWFLHPLLPDLKNFVQMVLLYILSFNAFKEEEDQKRLVVLLAGMFLLICIRDIRNFSVGSAFSYDKRSSGPFWTMGLGPNHFGAFLAYAGSFFLGLLMFDKHKKRRILYIAAVCCAVYPLFSTYSRGAWVACVAALLIFGLLKARIILVGVAAMVVSWQAILPPTVVERITMTETEDGEIEESAAIRLLLWERAEKLFQDNPAFGIGYQGFSRTVEIGGLTNVHNFYMQTAADQGVIGLLFFAAVLLRCAFGAFGLFLNGNTDFRRGLGLGLLGAVTTMAVSNVFGDRWSYFSVCAWFWVLWGVADRAAVESRLVKKPGKEDIATGNVTQKAENTAALVRRRG